MNFALWSQNCVSGKLVTLPPAQADRYGIMWQKSCHIFVSNFTRLKFCSLPYSAAWQVVCEIGNLTKMNTDNSSQRDVQFSDWRGWSSQFALNEKSGVQPRSEGMRVCVVTCWGRVVHWFNLHARHVSASMLTWFCPCCDTPAPALTITFAYSVLHR